MEAILVRPRDERAMAALQSFLKGMQGAFTSRARPETLEGKITRLHQQGHYEDWEVEWFFSIPKERRVDPFETSPSGDVCWADKRNVDDLDSATERARKDRDEGKLVRLGASENLDDFWERIMADESI